MKRMRVDGRADGEERQMKKTAEVKEGTEEGILRIRIFFFCSQGHYSVVIHSLEDLHWSNVAFVIFGSYIFNFVCWQSSNWF